MRWLSLRGLRHVLLHLHLPSGDVAGGQHYDIPVCVGLPGAGGAKQPRELPSFKAMTNLLFAFGLRIGCVNRGRRMLRG